MDLGLSGRGVVVTGGTRGIGLAIAEACAREGANLAICGRTQDSLQRAQEALAATGCEVFAELCDVAVPAALTAFVDKSAAALGSLHGLVNNPSGFGFADDEESWRRGIEVDLMGVVRATWAARPHLAAGGGGAIVNLSSISGIGASGSAAYGAVKAAVIHLTQSHARSLAPERIRVNCIAPGSIEFPGGLWEERRRTEPDAYRETLATIPFGRMGRAEEVARVAAFLMSDAASWVTGQIVVVDGGQTL